MEQIEPLLKIQDVAKRLNVSTSTVRNKITAKDWGSVPKPSVTIGRSYRWKKEDLEAFINGCQTHYKIADKNRLPANFAKYIKPC